MSEILPFLHRFRFGAAGMALLTVREQMGVPFFPAPDILAVPVFLKTDGGLSLTSALAFSWPSGSVLFFRRYPEIPIAISDARLLQWKHRAIQWNFTVPPESVPAPLQDLYRNLQEDICRDNR